MPSTPGDSLRSARLLEHRKPNSSSRPWAAASFTTNSASKPAPSLDLAALAGTADHNITLLPYKDVGACVASGSFKTDGMVVIPCSSNKLAELAHGLGDNLISRAAQVVLKERRRLVIVHRETPLGLIELRNMLQLTEAGAIICPANPGFYNLPQSVDDLVNMLVGRVLDLSISTTISTPAGPANPAHGNTHEEPA